MTQVLTAAGDAWVDPRREEEARKMLKDIDPLLDIRWMDVVKRHALLIRWHDNDKRWEAYRAGEIGDPHDLLGWFVEPDAHGNLGNGYALPRDPLEMMDVVVAYLGRMDNTRHPWRKRMQETVEHNARLQRARRDEIVDETVEAVKYLFKRQASEPIVNLGDGSRESVQPRTLQHSEKPDITR